MPLTRVWRRGLSGLTEEAGVDEETEEEGSADGEDDAEEAGEAYLYGYDPTDNFSVEQEFYNSLFGYLFLPPREEEVVDEEAELANEGEEELSYETVDIPGAYSEEKHYEYLDKEAAAETEAVEEADGFWEGDEG